LGAFGTYYFDTLIGKVVSTEREIGSEAVVPNGMLRELLSETERNGAAVVLTVRDSSISGTFADWLLHANLPIEIKQRGNKTIFYIVLKDKKTAQEVRDYLNEHKIVEEYQIRMNELK
jgi:tetraacyldisaccharide-1-P 4'-kinase